MLPMSIPYYLGRFLFLEKWTAEGTAEGMRQTERWVMEGSVANRTTTCKIELKTQ